MSPSLRALLMSATLATTGLIGLTPSPAAAAATGGVGASLPYVELQAESAATNGTVIGPSAVYNTLPAEASYRKAVTLAGTGKYVEFTTTAPANSIVFRFSIPDSGSGSVYTAPISLYINGTRQSDFTLTNAYSWYYGGYPFTNSPGSNAHHFYDEVNRLFTTTYPAGTKFRLQVDTAGALSYTIDFADFENVAGPLSQPAGSVSITSKGADPTGVNDSTSAMNQAIASAGAGGTVWIPPGTFKILGHIAVNNVTIKGAGMWHSRTQGDRIGFYGNFAPTPSTNVHLSDFAIFGNVQERNDGDQVNGIGGALTDSTVDRVWIEHTKVGAWMDGPFTNLVFNQMRLRNFTADGVNFHNGVTGSKVTNSDIRNAGDDGLATWSDTNADANNSFDHNTVQYPILANGIAIYGGHDNFVTDNRIIDSGLSQGGGIHVAQRFASTPLGRTDVLRNTIIRSGSLDPNWQFGVGALWFDARDAAMSGLTNVDNILIQQSPFEAIQFVSGSSITNVQINNATIQNTGTWVVQEQVGGSARITNSTATGTQAPAAVYNCGVGFTLTDGGGNSGIFGSTACQNITTAAFPPYLPDNGSNLIVSPSALGFGSVATGTTSAAQNVTVTNSGTAPAPVSSIAMSGDFSQTNTCGTSIAAGASCTVSVRFAPTATGNRTGNLTITASSITNTVPLSGTGVAPGPVLSANPASLTFPATVVGSAAASQTVTLTNSGTTSATISGVSAGGDFSQTNNCGTSLAVGASCTVTVGFTPSVSGNRTGTLTVTSNANNSPTTVALSGSGIGTTTNIALGRPATASSQVNGAQTPPMATDGDANTYWESANNAFPQWLQVDLGATYSIGKVTLRLPPQGAWGTRTQTLSVLASANGSTFSTVVNSATYTFTSPTNVVNISVPATSARYVRVNFTANSGWPAGQASEFEVYPSGGTSNSATLSTSPSSLTFPTQALNTTSSSQAVTVTNTGTAAASVSGVSTSGDFSQTNTCGTSIAAGASCTVNVSFRPTASGTRTGTLTITSSATNSPATVSLTGTGAGTTPVNLAAGKPTSESSHTDVYPSGNTTDGNQNTYWESANNAFPQWVQVDLGSSQSAGRIVLQLPAAWGARTQTLSVLASNDGSNFTTVKASAGYSFSPTANNTVTITFTATSQRYWRLNFTANTGWPAGQVSEFQVWNQ